MVETKTTGSAVERGPANQRHFARAVDNDIDGAIVVVSYGTRHVAVSAPGESARDVLEAAAEYGGAPELALGGNSRRLTGLYHDGELAIDVRFE